jgi:hypothetical protein
MALESQVTPNSTNEILPRTPSQGSRPFHHCLWGKDRRWISWKQSAHAIVFSPCQSLRLTSGTDICANTLLTFRKAGLNALVVFIPLARVSHFREWSHGTTFAHMPSPFAVNLCVHRFSYQSVSPLLSHSKRCFTGAQSSSQCTAVQTWAT